MMQRLPRLAGTLLAGFCLAAAGGVASSGARRWPKTRDHLLVDLESCEKRDCALRYDSASSGRSVILGRESSRVVARIENETERAAQIWVRCYFDYERCAAGDANSFFWSLDDGERRAFSHNEKDCWIWAKLGQARLATGKHTFVFEPRERPARLDCLVLFDGDDPTTQPWYTADYPDGLPFGLPNPVPHSQARRISHWRVVGGAARQTPANLDRDQTHETARSIKLRLPANSAPAVLVSGRAIRSVAPEAPELQPEAVSLCMKSSAPGVEASVIGTDADGEYSRLALPAVGGHAWQRLLTTLPPGLQAPVEITHLVFVNKASSPVDVWLEEPDFTRQFDLRILRGSVEVGARSVSGVMRLRGGPAQSKTQVWWHLSLADDPRTILPGTSSGQTLDVSRAGETRDIPVKVKLPADAPTGQVLAFRYGIGLLERPACYFALGDGKALATWLRDRERAAGAFRFDAEGRDRPLRTRDGQAIHPEQVTALYGTELTVLADGVDVCSQGYADEVSNRPLRPVAYDLSNEAGWPDTPVTPGELAIDPTLGRFKFSEGNGDNWAEVGFCRTGFGVPGLPVAVHGDFAFAPAAEGDLTIIDVRDPDHPRIASFLPTWHAYGGRPMPRGRWLYMTFRPGFGKPVIMVAEVNDPSYPGPFRPTNVTDASLLWLSPDGRRAVYCRKKEPAAMVCADLVSPRELRSLGSVVGVTSGLVRNDGLMAAAVLTPSDATRMRPDLVMIDLADRQKPQIRSRLANDTRVIKERGREHLESGTPGALSSRYLIVRRGSTLDVVKIEQPGKPVWLATHDFGSDSAGPSCAISGGRLYVATGRQLLRYRLDSFRAMDEEALIEDEIAAAAGEDWKKGLEDELWQGAAGKERMQLPPPVRRPRELAPFPEPELAFDAPEPWRLTSITIRGKHLFVSDAHYGLRIFEDTGKGFRLRGSVVIAAEGRFSLSPTDDLAMIAHTFGGQTWLIDTSDPTRPRRRGVLCDGYRLRYATRHACHYPCLYLVKESGRLEAVDVSDPDHPQVVWHAADSEGKDVYPASVHVSYGRLFVTGRDCKLYEYEIDDPKQPSLLSQITLSPRQQYFRMAAWRNHVFALGQHDLVAVDVSKPGKPRLAGTLDISDHIRELAEGYRATPTVSSCAVVRGVLYATTGGLLGMQKLEAGNTKLDRYDVRNPSRMRSLGLFDPVEPGGWGDVYGDVISYGPVLFSATYLHLETTDVSDPLRPKRMPPYFRCGQSCYQFSVGALRGRYLYIPATGGLAISRPPLPPEVPRGEVRGRSQ